MSQVMALELNDLGVTVAGAAGTVLAEPSPGWAVFEPDSDRIRVGAEAAARLRLNPRLAHRKIWSELDLTPLASPFPRGLSAADLAYAHLRSVWNETEERLGRAVAESDVRLLAAPASYTAEQLGLALGIAESLDRRFTGVVDSAVAAASALDPEPGPSVVLDLELGRVVGTSIGLSEREGATHVFRVRALSQQGAGWNALLDAWARAVGRAFIATTRFDPLHAAASEQELYDLLPEWLAALTEREAIQASMSAGGREHTIVLRRGEVAAAAEPTYARVVELARTLTDSGAMPLVATDRIGRAPGLIERLEAEGFGPLRVLPARAALDGALRHADRLHRPSEPSPLWVTGLPIVGETAAPAATPGAEG